MTRKLRREKFEKEFKKEIERSQKQHIDRIMEKLKHMKIPSRGRGSIGPWSRGLHFPAWMGHISRARLDDFCREEWFKCKMDKE